MTFCRQYFLKLEAVSEKKRSLAVNPKLPANCIFINLTCMTLVKHLKAGHHWPASETPFKWRFAGGPIFARLFYTD